MSARRAVLGLGSNIGSREALLRAATELIERERGIDAVLARSRIWETAPLGPPQPSYFNAAIAVRTTMEPEALMTVMHGIERLLGRERREKWGPRTIDVDLLWMDGVARASPPVLVPHPGLLERAFALGPLLEVAPDAVDPRTSSLLSAHPLSEEGVRARWAFADRFDTVEMEHTADEAVIVRARDRADLLAAAGEALGGLMVEPASVALRECQSIEVTAPENEPWPDDERMFGWLSEVLYRMDAKRFAVRRAVVFEDSETRVRGAVWGESLDEAKHSVRGALKAVTYHALEVGRVDDGTWRAQVVIDV